MRLNKSILSVAVTAATVSMAVAGANAAYIADFDTTGSAADFTAIRSNNVGTSASIAEANVGGDDRLNVSTNRGASTSTQVQYIAAPTNFEGAEVAVPTGGIADPARIEARLRFGLEAIDLGAVPPFTAFGFAAFQSATNTADFADKIIGQLDSVGTGITLKAGLNNPNVPSATLASYTVAAGLPKTFELQVTDTEMRLLENDLVLTGTGTDANGWVAHGISSTSTDFTGNSLIPFFGVIRAASQFNGTTNVTGAGFDDISVTNAPVPEPTSLALFGIGAMGLLARRRRTA